MHDAIIQIDSVVIIQTGIWDQNLVGYHAASQTQNTCSLVVMCKALACAKHLLGNENQDYPQTASVTNS